MAIIVYQCTVCDRVIEIPEQASSFERINQCIITNECRGTLFKTDRKEDFVVGQLPPDVIGLTNYIQRKVLFNHEQSIAKDVWTVTHNLGVNPSVQVIVNRTEEVDGVIQINRVEIEPNLIEIINKNTVQITFDRPETGLAQCIARSSAPNRAQQIVEVTTGVAADDVSAFQLSNSGILTIAVDDESFLFGSPQINGVAGSPPVPIASVPVTINYLNDPDGFDTTDVTSVEYSALFPPISSSPWNDANFVFIDGKKYTVRTIAYGDPVNDEGIPNGTSVFLDQQNDGIAQNSIFLLALPPFANVDRDRRRIFRSDFSVGPKLGVGSFIFGNGNFFLNNDVIEDIFPPVYVIPL